MKNTVSILSFFFSLCHLFASKSYGCDIKKIDNESTEVILCAENETVTDGGAQTGGGPQGEGGGGGSTAICRPPRY